jgi:hypothetical protein
VTVKLDPELCRTLAAECGEDDQRMEDAPWTVVEHDQVQRFVVTARDGRSEISRDLADEDALGIARTRNNLAAIATQPTAAAKLAARPAISSADVAIVVETLDAYVRGFMLTRSERDDIARIRSALTGGAR